MPDSYLLPFPCCTSHICACSMLCYLLMSTFLPCQRTCCPSAFTLGKFKISYVQCLNGNSKGSRSRRTDVKQIGRASTRGDTPELNIYNVAWNNGRSAGQQTGDEIAEILYTDQVGAYRPREVWAWFFLFSFPFSLFFHSCFLLLCFFFVSLGFGIMLRF
jgi:hypothetical protein